METTDRSPVAQSQSTRPATTVLSYLYHLLKRTISAMVTIVTWFAKAIWWVARLLIRIFLAITKPAMRFVAFLFFIVAAIALVADLTPFLDHGRTPNITSVAEHWTSISPRSLAAVQATLTEAASTWAWQALEVLILNVPTFLTFGTLGALAAYAGRRRSALNVYAN